MFKKIIICFLFLSSPGISFSQSLMWVEQNSGTIQTLTSVCSNYYNHVWACGYGGVVIRSTNFGATWTNASGNGIPVAVQLINIAAFYNDIALTAGYLGTNTYVYRTSDGGANWTQVFIQSNGFVDGIRITSDTNSAFMMGDPVGGRWSLWKTTTGGINWDSSGLYLPQVGTEASWVNSIFDIGNDKIWFGTNNSRVYYSSNSGSSWAAQPTTGELNSYAVWFCGLPDIVGYTGFTGGATLLKTSNSGTNWLSQTSTGAGNFGGFSGGPNIITSNAAGYLIRFYVRSDNKIYTSTNNGSNWTADYTATAGTYRYLASDFNGTHFWAVRTNGGISYLDLPVAISNAENQIPLVYSLSQNYPNPFNPSTRISFALPKSNAVKLTIFDLAGKEVKIILDEFKPAGSYEEIFDGSNLPSGIYFYKLEVKGVSTDAEENFVSSKKMILIK